MSVAIPRSQNFIARVLSSADTQDRLHRLLKHIPDDKALMTSAVTQAKCCKKYLAATYHGAFGLFLIATAAVQLSHRGADFAESTTVGFGLEELSLCFLSAQNVKSHFKQVSFEPDDSQDKDLQKLLSKQYEHTHDTLLSTTYNTIAPPSTKYLDAGIAIESLLLAFFLAATAYIFSEDNFVEAGNMMVFIVLTTCSLSLMAKARRNMHVQLIERRGLKKGASFQGVTEKIKHIGLSKELESVVVDSEEAVIVDAKLDVSGSEEKGDSVNENSELVFDISGETANVSFVPFLDKPEAIIMAVSAIVLAGILLAKLTLSIEEGSLPNISDYNNSEDFNLAVTDTTLGYISSAGFVVSAVVTFSESLGPSVVLRKDDEQCKSCLRSCFDSFLRVGSSIAAGLGRLF